MTASTAFADLGLGSQVLRALEDMGFEEPSPIQRATIPACLAGHDVIGQAQTGTGKTAAFGIPIVERVEAGARRIGAVVLTPTRELCIQVAEEIARIGRHRRIKVVPVYGGQSFDRQVRAFRHGAQVIIGTPGRVVDHLRRGTLDLSSVRMAVLDEADEMLDMGFIEDMEFILQHTPDDRQTLLFSATMPAEVVRLSKRYMRDPQHIAVSREQLTVPQIEQVFYEVRGYDKVDALTRIIDMEEITRAIIFGRTKKGVAELSEALNARGYLAEGIHGDLNQAQRLRVMQKFRDGSLELLVATDVAARGLDIDNVTHVINFDVPQDPESYVHRIGRTGRAGRTGTAITLIEPREFQQLRQIERTIKQRIRRRDLPSLSEILEKQRETLRDRLLLIVELGHLDQYREIVDDLVDELDPLDIAAATLKLHLEGEREATRDPAARVAAEFGDTGGEPGMVRFFINIGRADGVSPADIVRDVAGQTEIPGKIIGKIDIFDRFTFVEVPSDVASQVFERMQASRIKGRTINIEPARRR